MNGVTQRIKELAFKWTNGTITPEEQQEFLQWYNNIGDEEPMLIPEHFAKDELTHGLRMLNKVYAEAGITEGETSIEKRSVPLLRRNWLRYAAVLVVVAGIGILAYFLADRQPQPELVLKPSIKPVDIEAPASVHAMITLDDGRKIILDSLANGTVSLQGAADFIKVNDGQIEYHPNSDINVFSTLVNPRGSRVIQVTLADGTRVWLNSESSIRYPNSFSGERREVEVTGETYFEVAKNESMPFIVKKGKMQVRVLGTHFDVNAYEDEDQLSVTLLEGSVRVSNGTFASTQLKPGEQSQLDHAGKLTKLSNVDVEKVVAWKNGKFDFGTRTDINTILRQIARWYNMDLEYSDTTLRSKYYGGSISRDVNLSEVLKVLETTGDIKFEIRDKKLKVLQRD